MTTGGFEPEVHAPERRALLDIRRLLTALTDRVTTAETQLGNLPAMIQSGSIVVTASGTPTATDTVTFPAAFASTPNFVCNLRGSGNLYVVTAGSTTATTAPVFVFRADGANVTIDRTVNWIAVGNPA